MISKEMADRLSQQMANEFSNQQTYLAMSTYFRAISLNGLAEFFRKRAEEERGHAMKFMSYMEDQSAPLSFLPIQVPVDLFVGASVLKFAEVQLSRELSTTKEINDLHDLAEGDNDKATAIFLQPLISEQVEEEALSVDFLNDVRRVQDSGDGLLILDERWEDKP